MTDGPILVTGASGLLGSWLRRTAPPDVQPVSLIHRDRRVDGATVVADLRDPAATADAVSEVRPTVVLHAAYAQDEPSIVAATGNVAAAAESVGAAVVLVSTDAVYSGDGRVRSEDDPPDPVWDYGRWKAQAEGIVLAGGAGNAVVRLPLVVSIEPDDHAVRRIRAAAAGGERTVWFDDELRQPAAASELAEALWRIVSLEGRARSGVWHLPGPERLSRHDIARRVAAALGLADDSVGAEATPPGLDRPRRLVLGDRRAREEIGWSPSPILC